MSDKFALSFSLRLDTNTIDTLDEIKLFLSERKVDIVEFYSRVGNTFLLAVRFSGSLNAITRIVQSMYHRLPLSKTPLVYKSIV